MRGMEYFKVITTIAIAVTGWVVGHIINSMRDVRLKKRETSTKYLIDAYRVLSHEINNRDLTEERKVQLENLIADIQLFGSIDQINLAKRLAEEIVENTSFSLDPLINSLRDSLRDQLGLGKVTGNVRWLRFRANSKKK